MYLDEKGGHTLFHNLRIVITIFQHLQHTQTGLEKHYSNKKKLENVTRDTSLFKPGTLRSKT